MAKIQLTVWGWRCERCGHEWVPRQEGGEEPRVCPKCKSAYWDLFAGAHGHTYGCHDIWQFLDTDRFPAVSAARTPWRKAIHLPGANQMRHVRALMESRLGRDRLAGLVLNHRPRPVPRWLGGS